MPRSNPYPERAIASFVLVGAMGMALFFVGSPVENNGYRSPIVAEDKIPEPSGRGGATPASAAPAPTAPSASAPESASVFSEAASLHGADIPATYPSSAPAPTQTGSSAVPVTPEPTPAPAPDPSLLQCALPVTLLDRLVCTDEIK